MLAEYYAFCILWHMKELSFLHYKTKTADIVGLKQEFLDVQTPCFSCFFTNVLMLSEVFAVYELI